MSVSKMAFILLAGNGAVYVAWSSQLMENFLKRNFELSWQNLFHDYRVWTLFTSQFSHTEASHFIPNMICLLAVDLLFPLVGFKNPTLLPFVYVTSGFHGACASMLSHHQTYVPFWVKSEYGSAYLEYGEVEEELREVLRRYEWKELNKKSRLSTKDYHESLDWLAKAEVPYAGASGSISGLLSLTGLGFFRKAVYFSPNSKVKAFNAGMGAALCFVPFLGLGLGDKLSRRRTEQEIRGVDAPSHIAGFLAGAIFFLGARGKVA